MNTHRYLAYFVLAISLFLSRSVVAQTDSLWLKNGTLKTGGYKVSHNNQKVESIQNPNESYDAPSVRMLATKDGLYATISLYADGSNGEYLAKRLMDSVVDLYGVDFPSGYFNANSIAQSFYFFEKDGIFTYVNKVNLEAFYTTYFGSCYDGIAKKTLFYNANSIIKMLNAYNKCLNPDFKEQVVEPHLKAFKVYVIGGGHRLTHNPKYFDYEGGDFRDEGMELGIGFNWELVSKLNLGLEFHFSKHTVESPTIRSYLNPGLIIYDYNKLGARLSCTYNIKAGKFAIKPGLGVGFSKLNGYEETRIQPIGIPPPFDEDFLTFKQLFNDFIAFGDISYQITNRFSLVTRLGYEVSLSKSRAGFNYFPDPSPEGAHNVYGGSLLMGVQYRLNKDK